MPPLLGLLLFVPELVMFLLLYGAQERFLRVHSRRYGLWPDTPWWFLLPWHPRHMLTITKAFWRRDPDPEVEGARRRVLRLLFLMLAYFLAIPILVSVLYALLDAS